METCRPCGCKGIRTCLICEKEFGINKPIEINKEFGTYVYCPYCDKAWPGWDISDYKIHPHHQGKPIDYPGIYIQTEFLTETEETQLIKSLDEITWDLSQSGRRKQNFGPKCNFKKNKLKPTGFNGFPLSTKFVQDKFNKCDILANFQTIEQCTLEYDATRGASIDPHIDDCWIWGERIVTVNLLSDSVLTMTYNTKPNSYNLHQVSTYPSCILNSGQNFNVKNDEINQPVVRVPMPRRSLLVIYGAARYDWEHQVLREDIIERRLCLAYREFTPPYLEGGKHFNKSESILQIAKNFY